MHSDKNIGYEIKRQKSIEHELGFELKAINETFWHIKPSPNQLIKQSTKKSLIQPCDWVMSKKSELDVESPAGPTMVRAKIKMLVFTHIDY